MPESAADLSLMPSLIDRLTDPESGGTSWRLGYGLQQMIDAVRADLEELLNTHQTHGDVPPRFEETRRSVLAYGLPDMMSLRAASSEERAGLGRMLEDIIGRFEPRLKHTRVSVVDRPDDTDRRVRFHVDALLAVDPAPEVGFVTIVELATGRTSVTPRAK